MNWRKDYSHKYAIYSAAADLVSEKVSQYVPYVTYIFCSR